MKLYKRNCNVCGKYYIGRGRYFCSQKCFGDYYSKNYKHSDEIKIKLKKMALKRWKKLKSNKRKFDEWRRKNSESKKGLKPWNKDKKMPIKMVKKQIKGRMKSLHISPNKPEKILINLFNKFNFPYKFVGDGEIIIGKYNPDFINCNGQKKLIELYGDYWHKNDNPQDRINYFKKYGFETLILWEHELDNKKLVFQRIKNFEQGV